MFGMINTNQTAKIDKDGRKYIIHPVTKEKMYEVVMPLFDNKVVGVQAMDEPVGLAFALRFANGEWDKTDD